jgi:hypothetical protein
VTCGGIFAMIPAPRVLPIFAPAAATSVGSGSSLRTLRRLASDRCCSPICLKNFGSPVVAYALASERIPRSVSAIWSSSRFAWRTISSTSRAVAAATRSMPEPSLSALSFASPIRSVSLPVARSASPMPRLYWPTCASSATFTVRATGYLLSTRMDQISASWAGLGFFDLK